MLLEFINGTYKKIFENDNIQPDFLKFKFNRKGKLKIKQIYNNQIIRGKGTIEYLNFQAPQMSHVKCKQLISKNSFINKCEGEGEKFFLAKMKYKVVHQFINENYSNTYYFENGIISNAIYIKI